MKVFLQNVKTGLLFRDLGEWTDDNEKARAFPNSLIALDFCNLKQLDGIQILLRFDQPRYDVRLPFLARP